MVLWGDILWSFLPKTLRLPTTLSLALFLFPRVRAVLGSWDRFFYAFVDAVPFEERQNDFAEKGAQARAP